MKPVAYIKNSALAQANMSKKKGQAIEMDAADRALLHSKKKHKVVKNLAPAPAPLQIKIQNRNY
jgi:hypothetical protein